MSNKWKSIADIRREYGQLSLDTETAPVSPFDLFSQWFNEGLDTEKSDPTAMVLSTVDDCGHPDSRVVLLKGIEDNGFVFFTNYESSKAQQIEKHSVVALNFYWPQLSRQIRIRGKANKVSQEASDQYFASRPFSSQVSAIVSPQSQIIPNRALLEKPFNEWCQTKTEPLSCPSYWGGYRVLADEMEFWQGRDNRLHDRIKYVLIDEKWDRVRLAP